MARKKRQGVVFGGTAIPDLFVERTRGRTCYYFKNAQGNKVRREDLKDAVKALNDFKQSKGEELIPIVGYEVKKKMNLVFEDAPQDYEPGGKYYDPDVYHSPDSSYGQTYALLDSVPRPFLIEQFRKMLEEDPHRLAQDLGVEQIAFLDKVQPRQRHRISVIGGYYFHREKHTPKPALRPKIKRESEQYWDEFLKIVNVNFVDELDKTILNQYNSELTKVAKDPSYRPKWMSKWQKSRMEGKVLTTKWIKVRLDTVKTVFKNALHVVENTTDIDNAARLCQNVFFHVPLPKQIVKQIFERKHIDAIFYVLNNPKDGFERKAYVRWKAIILMALNCAFTPVDFVDLKFSDLNFEKKELTMIRKKENTERYAVLWERTVGALQDYLKSRPQSKECPTHVFLNRNGKLLKSDNFCDDFKYFLKKVNEVKPDAIPPVLTFKFFRKSAASSAERTPGANPSEVSYLMGHSSGIRAHYTHRAADLVGNVCKKIEQDYFG